ncbi:hypothetical protein MUP01_13260 [Candidatus Bathyarchaeota archaeon]|nr:hypothetical protein [Candidatus Bathyarchaeota archaeon]
MFKDSSLKKNELLRCVIESVRKMENIPLPYWVLEQVLDSETIRLANLYVRSLSDEWSKGERKWITERLMPKLMKETHTFINITNIQGVTVIGEGNYVHSQYSDLYQSLDLLGEGIRQADRLSDEAKLNYQAEIETIKSQLLKPNPDRSILKTAWNALKGVATVGGVVSALEKVRALIQPLLR